MIEASFLAQYGIRLRGSDLEWDEFCTLLSGIMPKTPLGQVVSIRSEDDKEMLKNFNEHQKKIRQDWRSKQAKLRTDDENEQMMKQLEEVFARAFG
ncbi:Bacteriophage Gp15 protein [Peptostreptococcus russellii]|uniref:Bacteriophage Gp15 protein n=1 Tax=Peptostreptococcus russellii TaxID=215200 RepID=A0A1H8JXL5_9FIRM|nr:Bacteriophage Gp15 protein [Peptostreptococcus russellii]